MFKRSALFVLFIIQVFTCLAILNGSGSQEDPYIVADFNDLIELSSSQSYWSANKYIKQTADIDASSSSLLNNGQGFLPIADTFNKFSGHYDGQGYKISDLFVNAPGYRAGLFGATDGAIIKNVCIINANFNSDCFSGGLVAYGKNTQIINCSSSGNISATNEISWCGGLAGILVGNSLIHNSFSSADVSGNTAVGGLTNTSQCYLEINNCYFVGSLSGYSEVGGIIGRIYSNYEKSISNCYVNANISSVTSELTGMIVGLNNTSNINNCFYIDNEALTGVGTGSPINNLPLYSISSIDDNQMSLASTFTNQGWDFDTTWFLENPNINNGYPYLFWQQDCLYELLIAEDNNQVDFISPNLNTAIHFSNPLETDNQLMIRLLSSNDLDETGIAENSTILGDNFWRISTNYQDSLTYTIVFDLDNIVTSFTDNNVAFYKRANENENWQNVVDLGASINCVNGQVTISNLSSFSDFIPVLKDGSLPVQLTSFTANLLANNTVNLSWLVEAELNLLGYYLLSGITNDIQKATLIPSLIHASNSIHTHEYNFQHKPDNSAEYLYYWLKSIEINNESNLYGPIMVKMTNSDVQHPNIILGNQLFPNFPNPFNPTTCISFSIDQAQDVKISVYNTKGQLVKVLFDSFVSKSQTKQSIYWNGEDQDENTVASGIYIVKMNVQNETISRKMILQK